MDELPIVTRLNAAAQLLCGLETGQDCADYAFARGDGFLAMTYIPEAFEALRVLPEAADLITELVEAVRGLRANDGSNGIYHAGKCYDFGKQVDAILAKATTHER